jgi:2-dehydropantoate 2-reductase
MRVLVVGAGSTGGYFGGRLAHAGRDVTFLVRPARAGQLRRDGLHIVSPHGDLTVTPHLVTADAIGGPYDFVLLTVKAFALDAAIADVAGAIGPDTMIVPVLNGMRHIETLVARFGDAAVLGGIAFISTTMDDAGRIVHLGKPHDLTYGERAGGTSERVAALDATMQGAGFTARVSERIIPEMWEKWITLASLGGINCLMHGSIGDVVAASGGAAFATAFVDECVTAASAGGAQPAPVFVEKIRTMMTTPGSPFTSSMYRDLQAGSDVEADQIIGDLFARGTAGGATLPLLGAAYTSLKVYQAQRSA